MEKAGRSSAQLLELLQRAADELKTVRAQGAEVAAELEREKAAHLATKRALEKALAQNEKTGATLPPLGSPALDVTGEMPAPVEASEDQTRMMIDGLDAFRAPQTQPSGPAVGDVPDRTDVRALLEKEVLSHQATQEQMETLQAELKSARSDRSALQRSLGELQKQFDTEKTAALGERHESAAAFERQLVLSRQALNDARAALEAERQKVGALEQHVLEVQEARGALELQLQQLETGHQALVVELKAELEASVSRAYGEGEQKGQAALESEAALHAEEKTKHQLTAQKLLAERQKGRELEAALIDTQRKLEGLELRHQQVLDGHARSVQESEEKLTAATEKAHAERAKLEAQLAGLDGQLQEARGALQAAVDEQRFVERKYEELHRELLAVMDQRDHANRQLQALRRS